MHVCLQHFSPIDCWGNFTWRHLKTVFLIVFKNPQRSGAQVQLRCEWIGCSTYVNDTESFRQWITSNNHLYIRTLTFWVDLHQGWYNACSIDMITRIPLAIKFRGIIRITPAAGDLDAALHKRDRTANHYGNQSKSNEQITGINFCSVFFFHFRYGTLHSSAQAQILVLFWQSRGNLQRERRKTTGMIFLST